MRYYQIFITQKNQNKMFADIFMSNFLTTAEEKVDINC